MNPEEREELARLLPSPGAPVLTSDRHDLLKDHLMRELTRATPESQATRDSQATPEVHGNRESRDSVTPPAPRKPSPRRRFALIAVPLATATAVAAAAVVIGTGAFETPTPDQKAVDLLNRIATVAAAKEPVPARDDQYVYLRTQGSRRSRTRTSGTSASSAGPPSTASAKDSPGPLT